MINPSSSCDFYDNNRPTDPLIFNNSINRCYSTTFSIWNSGSLIIEKQDIRKDIEIYFLGIDSVIDIHTIKEVEPNIANMALIPNTHNKFRLDWKFFDPSYGIKVDIKYIGLKKLICQVQGKIYSTNINEFKYVNWNKLNRSERIGILMNLTIFILMIYIQFKYTHHSIKMNKSYRTARNQNSFDISWAIMIAPTILWGYFAYVSIIPVISTPF